MRSHTFVVSTTSLAVSNQNSTVLLPVKYQRFFWEICQYFWTNKLAEELFVLKECSRNIVAHPGITTLAWVDTNFL